MDPRKTIYAIYAREDNDVLLHLLHHLKPLEEEFMVTIWHDDPIDPGKLWKPHSIERLQHAEIFLLLVSDAFMHSEFVKQLEFKRVIDSYKEGRAIVIPIIVDRCPWDIDFKSDDYDFNFKELRVLPEEGKPISEWSSFERAYSDIAAHIKAVVESIAEKRTPRVSAEDWETKPANDEDQDFQESELTDAPGDRPIKAASSAKVEIEAEREANAQSHLQETEAHGMAEEALRKAQEVEATANLKKEEAIRGTEEVDAQGLLQEAEAQRLAEEARIQIKKIEEAPTNVRKTEKERIVEEERDAKRKPEIPSQQKIEVKTPENDSNLIRVKKRPLKKGVRMGSLVGVLAAVGLLVFLIFRPTSKKSEPIVPKMQVADSNDSVVLHKTQVDSPNETVSSSKLGIGDTIEGGIIFSIGHDKKPGMVAHFEDAGPMPWKEAIKIHQKLGEGWRLPTLDELALMYRTVGQGASNTGRFVNELYWSTTPFDSNQARLLRFSDGNTSFHYNKNGEFRKFRVRAIRDFSE